MRRRWPGASTGNWGARPGQARGQGAFADATLPHLDAAFSLAVWLVRDPALAEEVVQDAFERALRYFPSFRGEGRGDGSARAWLLAIVRSAALDALGRGRRRAEVPLPEETEMVEPTAGPEIVARDREAVRSLADALAALPDELRECVVLRELSGLSYREIADAVGVPIGTVMSRLWRGRQSLMEWRAAWARAEQVP